MREVEAVPPRGAPHQFELDGELHCIEAVDCRPWTLAKRVRRAALAEGIGIWITVVGNEVHYQSD